MLAHLSRAQATGERKQGNRKAGKVFQLAWGHHIEAGDCRAITHQGPLQGRAPVMDQELEEGQIQPPYLLQGTLIKGFSSHESLLNPQNITLIFCL
jgi:hypothetical protein